MGPNRVTGAALYEPRKNYPEARNPATLNVSPYMLPMHKGVLDVEKEITLREAKVSTDTFVNSRSNWSNCDNERAK